MPNANKTKGDVFERLLLQWFRLVGFPGAERTRAGYERDGGDIHLDAVVGMAPGVIVQAKNVVRPLWTKWLKGLEEQIANARAEVGFIVWKRVGLGQAAQQLAVMRLDKFVELLRRAGYGDPLEHAAVCENCASAIRWIECPTGGWWAHDKHPADDHDAVTSVEIEEYVDDNGYWVTVGVKRLKDATLRDRIEEVLRQDFRRQVDAMPAGSGRIDFTRFADIVMGEITRDAA